MVLVSVSIQEARVSSTFFGGLEATRRWKLKKNIILENIKSKELSLVFSKIVSKGLCCDKVWEISIFPSCTPIRGIYRKSLLISYQSYRNNKANWVKITKLCSAGLSLWLVIGSCFALFNFVDQYKFEIIFSIFLRLFLGSF